MNAILAITIEYHPVMGQLVGALVALLLILISRRYRS
jgi:hypothetical protein